MSSRMYKQVLDFILNEVYNVTIYVCNVCNVYM